MIYQLKNANANQFPPQGWPFKDPKTGFRCNGYEGTPAMHAVKIIANRRANPHHYSPDESQWFDPNSVIQEIYAQKAATHPHLFKGYPDAHIVPRVQKTEVVSDKPCPKCGGTEWELIYCKTCAGRRVTGKKCKGCGGQS